MIDERIERYDHYQWSPEQLRALRQAGRFVVVRTKFHGGGIRSVHTRLRAALRAAAAAKVNKGRGREQCGCGCVGVIDLADYHKLPPASQAGVAAGELVRYE